MHENLLSTVQHNRREGAIGTVDRQAVRQTGQTKRIESGETQRDTEIRIDRQRETNR